MLDDLLRYFPEPIRKQHREPVMRHRLRREIVATAVTNSMVNRVGATFVNDMAERSGAAAHVVARAYLAARQVFDLRTLWAGIELVRLTARARATAVAFAVATAAIAIYCHVDVIEMMWHERGRDAFTHLSTALQGGTLLMALAIPAVALALALRKLPAAGRDTVAS